MVTGDAVVIQKVCREECESALGIFKASGIIIHSRGCRRDKGAVQVASLSSCWNKRWESWLCTGIFGAYGMVGMATPFRSLKSPQMIGTQSADA